MSGEKETTEPQALVSTAETMHDDGMIERLRKVLDEVRTNQAEHAAHLDHLAHRADLERTKRATDRMRLNGLAQEVKELRDKIRNAEQEAKGRIEKLSEELWALFERLDDKIDAQEAAMKVVSKATWELEEAVDAMHYRRMVGNLFRRVADAVDGG